MTTSLLENLEIVSVEKKVTNPIVMICLDTLPPLIASCDIFKEFLSKKIALYQLAFATSLHCKRSLEKNSLSQKVFLVAENWRKYFMLRSHYCITISILIAANRRKEFFFRSHQRMSISILDSWKSQKRFWVKVPPMHIHKYSWKMKIAQKIWCSGPTNA